MAEQRNAPIQAPRQAQAELNVPAIQPRSPELRQPANLAASVLNILGGLGTVASQVGQMRAQDRAEAQAQRRHLLVAEANDVAAWRADFDLSTIQPQGDEKPSQAVLRTLQSDARFQTLQPETQSDIYRGILAKYDSATEAAAKEALRLATWGEHDGMTQMLIDPYQRSEGLKNFDSYFERAQRGGLTHSEALGPLKAALLAFDTQGDTEGVKSLSAIVEKYGLQDDYQRALKGSEDQKRILAERAIATAKAEERLRIDQFSGSLYDSMIAVDQANPTPAALSASVDALKQSVIKANIPGDDKMRLLRAVDSWGSGTDKMDPNRLTALNARIDSVLRSGQMDASIKADILQAGLDGAFGRGLPAERTRQEMLKRLDSTRWNVAWDAAAPVKAEFDRYVSTDDDAASRSFLFDQQLRDMLTKHPDWTPAEVLQASLELSATLKDLPESKVRKQVDAAANPNRMGVSTPFGSVSIEVQRVSSDAEYDALPSGTVFLDPNGVQRRKP